MKTVFALVDCNNFYVSCERIFRPDLEGKPVVVLSSNDGCAVARSNEVKALGVPMGAPAFKYRELFKTEGVKQFSANFELYGDVSKRIVRILTELTPRTEIYSIDEAFLELSQLATANYQDVAQTLQDRIWNEVGIPVSIGIATSKTLAKLASEYAKKHPQTNGIVDFTQSSQQTRSALEATKIEHVWGVGWRLAPKLRSEGLATAADLANMSHKRARQLMGVRGEQMVRELNGETCFALQVLGAKPKSIARTRTFGEDTNQFHVIESALASFATQAAYRLRASNQVTQRAGLFAMTNRHKPGFRSWRKEIVFDTPTADTGLLIQAMVRLMSEIYEPGQAYHRAGVWLYDFKPAHYLQTDLLGQADAHQHDRSSWRMQSVDAVNSRFGRNTLRYAAEDLAQKWQPVHKLRSPRYTTAWDELPTVTVKKGTI
jgi:DNA polymerase V